MNLLLASSLVCKGAQAFAPASSTPLKHVPSSLITKRSNVIVSSSVTADDLRVNRDVSESPTAWECDEEANCVQVDACDEESCRTTLDVRIHGEWFDLSGKGTYMYQLSYYSGTGCGNQYSIIFHLKDGVRLILQEHIGLIGMMVVMLLR